MPGGRPRKFADKEATKAADRLRAAKRKRQGKQQRKAMALGSKTKGAIGL